MHVVALCLLAATFVAAEPEAVVLEFTAPSRCPPCQQIAPTVSRLQREGFPIKAIDVDTQPSAAAPYRLRAVPTFVLIIAGREVDRIEGKPEELELRRMCDRARLANAATEVTNGSHDEPTSSPPPLKKTETPVAPQSEPARPTPPTTNKPAAGTRGEPGKSEKDKSESAGSRNEPVIRAKHDGSTILPDASSTDPRHVSPRIRVKDSHGVNFGTGTIIDSREGRTTILT